jgi:hypothetical protein
MPRLPLMPHLSYEQLGQRFRHCLDGRQKARWQALWLLRRPPRLTRQPRPPPWSA